MNTYANALIHPRSWKLRTGRRGRRICRHNGCRNKVTHLGLANGLAMLCGCEWHVFRWLRDPEDRR